MRRKRSYSGGLTALNGFFFALAFLLLAVRDGATEKYWLAAGCTVFLLAGAFTFPVLFRIDKLLLALVNFFAALSLLLVELAIPDRLLPHLLALAAGYACLFCFLGLGRAAPESLAAAWLSAVLALVVLALPLAVSLPGSVGPAACVLLLLAFPVLLARRQLLPAALLVLLALCLMLLRGDWASALGLALAFTLLAWSSSGSWLVLVASVALAGGLGWAALRFLPNLSPGLLYWLSARNQAIAFSGGLFGTGLGLGSSVDFSKSASVLPLCLVGEQFGSVFLCCLVLVLAALLLRGVSIAAASRRNVSALRGMGAVILLSCQALAALGSLLGWLPLPAAGFPLLSFDPLSLVSAFALVGFLSGIHAANQSDLKEDTHLAMLAH